MKGLIVDDEYLARKGLILTIPWSNFDIEIAGEADSLESAMTFLESNSVDVVFTDISMPNGSGLELIKAIKERYDDIYVVIITCLREFELIQRAFRLGAIDYIVKTELEEGQLEECLSRICTHIKTEQSKAKTIDTKYGLVFVAPDYSSSEEHRCFQSADFFDKAPLYVMKGCYLQIVNQEEMRYFRKNLLGQRSKEDWIVTGLRNIEEISEEELRRFVIQYVASSLVYQYEEGVFEEVNVKEKIESRDTNAEQDSIVMRWLDLLWIYDEQEYKQLCRDTINAGVEEPKLKNVLRIMMNEWQSCFQIADIPAVYYETLEKIRFWRDYQSFLRQLRQWSHEQFQLERYSDETVHVMLYALKYMRNHYSTDFKQEEISKIFGISRSYFSRTFKAIFGVQFVEYTRRYRIERAKVFLRNSNLPVYEVAKKVGITDERYFSKTFQGIVGMKPTEYRKNCQK